jgi:hypothetical protein
VIAPTLLTLPQVEALKVEALYSAKAGLGRTFSDETVLRLITTIEVLSERLLREAARART